MQMKLKVLSYRYGQVDDGPHWCKVTVSDEQPTDTQGFKGIRTDEYSVATEAAQAFVSRLSSLKQFPSEVSFNFEHRRKSGAMQPVLTGINA